jgi:anti-sigma factor RsiW
VVTCRQLIEFIAAYVDGELNESEHLAFEHHLGNCRSCLAYLESYRRTMTFSKSLSDTPVDDVPEGLVEWILRHRG